MQNLKTIRQIFSDIDLLGSKNVHVNTNSDRSKNNMSHNKVPDISGKLVPDILVSQNVQLLKELIRP